MMIKRRANCLVKRLGHAASYLTQPCFVNGFFIDVVCSNSGYSLSASIPEDRTKHFTLVVMELVGIMTVQLVQELDDIGIGIGPAEGVPSTVEAKNKLVWLFGLFRDGGNHSRRDSDRGQETKKKLDGTSPSPS